MSVFANDVQGPSLIAQIDPGWVAGVSFSLWTDNSIMFWVGSDLDNYAMYQTPNNSILPGVDYVVILTFNAGVFTAYINGIKVLLSPYNVSHGTTVTSADTGFGFSVAEYSDAPDGPLPDGSKFYLAGVLKGVVWSDADVAAIQAALGGLKHANPSCDTCKFEVTHAVMYLAARMSLRGVTRCCGPATGNALIGDAALRKMVGSSSSRWHNFTDLVICKRLQKVTDEHSDNYRLGH